MLNCAKFLFGIPNGIGEKSLGSEISLFLANFFLWTKFQYFCYLEIFFAVYFEFL
jgi:hypothetical protein